MKENFDHAQAHVDRADAFRTLGRIDDALESYRAALAREEKFPNYLTQAYLELPLLIATQSIREKYGYALDLLGTNKARIMVPIEHFRWHTSIAFIAADCDNVAEAKTHAQYALELASLTYSGFRYHPTFGLVSDKYDGLLPKLREILRGST